MSPRSEEFASKASRRLAAARDAIGTGNPEAAVSSAYYAMLYAARAFLSEHGLHAKTHAGTWSEFARVAVRPGHVEQEVGRLGTTVQRAREDADYEAEDFTAEEAQAVLGDASRFVAAVLAALD